MLLGIFGQFMAFNLNLTSYSPHTKKLSSILFIIYPMKIINLRFDHKHRKKVDIFGMFFKKGYIFMVVILFYYRFIYREEKADGTRFVASFIFYGIFMFLSDMSELKIVFVLAK